MIFGENRVTAYIYKCETEKLRCDYMNDNRFLTFMKLIKSLAYIFILITTFSVHGFSQPTYSRIAVVDTDIFKDKQRGIKEVIEAYEKLEAEFKTQNDELNIIAEKAKKIVEEIKERETLIKKNPKAGCPVPIDGIVEEFKNLQTEYKGKDEQRKLLYDKRKAELFVKIDKKIKTVLKQFAKENNFETIYDLKELEEVSILVNIPDNFKDVTQKFIEFYNKSYSQNK